jgi:small subunit ribosomal protein S20
MAEKDKKERPAKRPSAEKRHIRSEKHRLINKGFKSTVRTAMRNFEEAVQSGDHTAIQARLSDVYSMMDKGVKRGIYKLNKASRTKMRANKKVASLSA